VEYIWDYRSIFCVYCHCLWVESLCCSRPVWQTAWHYYIEIGKWDSFVCDSYVYKLHWYSKSYFLFLGYNILVWFILSNCSVLLSLKLFLIYGLLPMLRIKYECPFLVGNIYGSYHMYFGQNGDLELLLRILSISHR
jgi:hypothetical protein